MKPCPYCGRKSDSSAASCAECGTRLLAAASNGGFLFHRSPPPKLPLMLALAATSVELPLLIAFLLVRCGPHFGPEWLYWPILTGLFPCFFASQLHLLPHQLSMVEFRIGEALFTACLIARVFAIASRTRFWRQLLTGAFGLSSVLAILAFMLLAA